MCWHRVAPLLAERFTVVCSDLRGCGDSSKPDGDPEHLNYSKRTMAQDQVEVMQALGFNEVAVVIDTRRSRRASTGPINGESHEADRGRLRRSVVVEESLQRDGYSGFQVSNWQFNLMIYPNA